ncbi:SprT family protein [Pontibacillus marinus]|uniref:Protein SprT-like n=1 Tax=Pontibacillus marinus BH030004 = DSM 16465 TaxID=1385511 RepID=A0A0A5G9M8_9BACI|nr:SprT family protein [Pontibacillus marinus]KGX87820.1 hypothetical protein N783_09030 [Pontibacillus marinus BH030004 = DSM 16465]
MNQTVLKEWVNEISEHWFGKPYPDEVVMNARLRTTGGRYIPKYRRIELNPKYLEEQGEEEFIGIIKHELCHYHLHVEGKGYQHRDREFKELMRETNSPRHCKPLPSKAQDRKHEYQCESCSMTYKRVRRVDVKRYRCGKCKGKLKKIH